MTKLLKDLLLSILLYCKKESFMKDILLSGFFLILLVSLFDLLSILNSILIISLLSFFIILSI